MLLRRTTSAIAGTLPARALTSRFFFFSFRSPKVYFGWCEQVISSIRNTGARLPESVIEDLKTKTKI